MEDTIVAISTSLGKGAISIIRVSGSNAIQITNKIATKDLSKVASHTINYCHIKEKNNIIDEVLISVMKSPKTYTKEDIIEINCHGGIATTNKILNLLLENGARLAEPGEFTKRAFLNGKIDLIKAEGIIDLINAKTENMRKLAVNEIDGSTSKLIENLRQKILEILANIEVNIDYPEYDDIEVLTNDKILPKLNNLEKELKEILKESENTKIIKEGVNVSIIGKPNVGKSSLLNKLIKEDKAIVTDIAGTTRDIVEGTIIIEGIIFNIIDTAGIRKTKDKVEQLGVQKSLDLIEKSDLVLMVLNNNEKITKEEIEILEKLKNKNHIIVVNKIDLTNKLDLKEYKNENIVYITTLKEEGIKKLKEEIKKIYNLEKIEEKDLTYLSNARSINLLKEAHKSILICKENIKNKMPIDIVEIDLKQSFDKLGEIIGKNYSDELIDQLFSQFCLGK